MNIQIIDTTNFNVRLKCTIQSSGKLGFTDSTALALKLEKGRYIKFGQDQDADNQMYMVLVDVEEAQTFKVCRAGKYYYVPTQAMFDAFGYDYKNKTYFFDLVRMSDLDELLKGEVYKMKKRTKDKVQA